MKYYLHDSNAFSDEKITMLFMRYGYEGLGLFYTLLEKLASQEKPIKTEVLKSQLKVGKKLEKCWKFIEEIELIHSNNGETFNKQLLNFSEKYRIKSEKNSKKISEWRKNQDDTKNVTGYEPVRNPPKVKESKVKESKVKESKVNNNTPVLFPELSGECAFNEYWDLYNKKVGDKKKCQKKWESLPIPERYKILEFIPLFKTQFTDIQYQPYPETFLSQKRWLDEIVIQKQVTIIEGQKTPQPTKRDFSRESDFN